MRSGRIIGGVGLTFVVLVGCPGDDGDGGTGTASTASTTAPGTVSGVSNEDGPSPVTCEELGGVCNCVGSCEPGTAPAGDGMCPQGPDEAGACSTECCVPSGSTSSTSAATGSSGSTSAGSSTGVATGSSGSGSGGSSR